MISRSPYRSNQLQIILTKHSKESQILSRHYQNVLMSPINRDATSCVIPGTIFKLFNNGLGFRGLNGKLLFANETQNVFLYNKHICKCSLRKIILSYKIQLFTVCMHNFSLNQLKHPFKTFSDLNQDRLSFEQTYTFSIFCCSYCLINS